MERYSQNKPVIILGIQMIFINFSIVWTMLGAKTEYE